MLTTDGSQSLMTLSPYTEITHGVYMAHFSFSHSLVTYVEIHRIRIRLVYMKWLKQKLSLILVT